MANPKYVRNRVTGIIYDFNPAALKRSENDFEPLDELPAEETPAEVAAEPVKEEAQKGKKTAPKE